MILYCFSGCLDIVLSRLPYKVYAAFCPFAELVGDTLVNSKGTQASSDYQDDRRFGLLEAEKAKRLRATGVAKFYFRANRIAGKNDLFRREEFIHFGISHADFMRSSAQQFIRYTGIAVLLLNEGGDPEGMCSA